MRAPRLAAALLALALPAAGQGDAPTQEAPKPKRPPIRLGKGDPAPRVRSEGEKAPAKSLTDPKTAKRRLRLGKGDAPPRPPSGAEPSEGASAADPNAGKRRLRLGKDAPSAP